MNTISKNYLSRVVDSAVEVRIVYDYDNIDQAIQAKAQTAITTNVVSRNRAPSSVAVGRVEEDRPPFKTWSYLAAKGSDLQLGDAVIVVNPHNGAPQIAYVYDERPINIDRMSRSAGGKDSSNPYFWQWIVQVIDFTEYNKQNSLRHEFAESCEAELSKLEQSVRTLDLPSSLPSAQVALNNIPFGTA
ncbi:hypothetical protein QJS83_14830 [Bdellovibrio sp. 22V]|uniref:hypothetical protein n=1 Tax=Bdellovibrio sp. 22V TaxID=3044166 RepID=UPI002543F682|nr:hypothetical protein [Bdellovibrio sp. 22V]WII71738.1 hypothetical protein QJS83_14830 [Bdellovibrio sp. 22V]